MLGHYDPFSARRPDRTSWKALVARIGAAELNIEAAWRVERRYLPHEDILKPQRVSVLLNVSSGTVEGTGRDRLLEQLKAAFDKQGISALLAFVPGPDLRPAAQSALQQATRGELDAIMVGGGDGSISTVAGVLAGSSVALGILPLGTLNHFAKDLKIPPAIEEAVAIMGLGETRAVDLGEVNGRIFINNSSIGLYL
jgi:diacylglycerol kinase family enzyme